VLERQSVPRAALAFLLEAAHEHRSLQSCAPSPAAAPVFLATAQLQGVRALAVACWRPCALRRQAAHCCCVLSVTRTSHYTCADSRPRPQLLLQPSWQELGGWTGLQWRDRASLDSSQSCLALTLSVCCQALAGTRTPVTPFCEKFIPSAELLPIISWPGLSEKRG